MKRLFALAALFAATTPALADLAVTGEGKASAKPDCASVYVSVQTDGTTAYEALQANNKSVHKLLNQTLPGLSIAGKDVQTSDFQVSPKYRYKQNEEPVLVGYTVVNSVYVKVRNLENVGKVLDGVVKDGANRVSGVQFTITDMATVLDQARQEAVKDARRRADLYATAAGVELGKVVSISETAAHRPQPRIYTLSASRAESRSADVPVSGGEMSFQVTINVVYSLGREGLRTPQPGRKADQ